MKRLTALALAALACNLFTPSMQEQAPAPTATSPALPEAQQPAPSVPPPTQSTGPPYPTEGAPAEAEEPPTMSSYQTWIQEDHSLDYPGHGCSDQSDVLNSVSELGGAVIPLSENYFYITWFPENWEQISDKRLIVSLHGSGGCAEKNFNWWIQPAQEHGYAIVAPQYAQEGSSTDELDFWDASQVYDNIRNILGDLHAHSPLEDTLVVYHGFSRGSALSFQIALMDRGPNGMGAFSSFISDSGGGFAESGGEIPGYLQNAPEGAYQGAHFWLYCGEKDHNGRTCQDMDRMEKIIPTLGGTVDEVYKYPPGGHGIFITAHNGGKSPALKAMFDYIQGLGIGYQD